MNTCSNQICQTPIDDGDQVCADCAAMNMTDPWANRHVVFADSNGDTLSEQEYSGFSEPDFVDPQIVKCVCGRSYSIAQWGELELVGPMPDGIGGTLELRNCPCGSTISRLLP